MREGAAGVGLVGVTALAGCFDGDAGEDGGGGGSYLAALGDPRATVVPSYHATYDCSIADLEGFAIEETVPDAAGSFIGLAESTIQGTELDDLDRVRGQYYRQIGLEGELTTIAPMGRSMVATGDWDVDGVVGWLEAAEFDDLGDASGYRRFGEIQDAFVRGFATGADALLFSRRSDVDVDPAEILDVEIDGFNDDDEPIRTLSPHLGPVVDALDRESFRAATQFELVAERPDTGTEAYDTVVSSLLAVGIAATIDDDETELDRVLLYRRGDVPSEDAIDEALSQAADDDETGPVLEREWSIDVDGDLATVSSTVATDSLRERPDALHAPLPVTGYDTMFTPVDPRDLGRDPPPRVQWDGELLDDGRIEVIHVGGESLEEDLVVSYVHDDEWLDETWSGPIDEGDTYTVGEPVDSGEQLRIRWAVGTVNETVLATLTAPQEQE